MRRLPIKRSKLLTAPLLPNSPNAAYFARAMYRLAYSTYLAQSMHARIGYMQAITTSFERKKYIDVKICTSKRLNNGHQKRNYLNSGFRHTVYQAFPVPFAQ